MTKEPESPANIAIIGCGFTGTTALHQLVRNYPVKHITLFESSGDFGPGFPYQLDESREYLLNNSNDTMCLAPSNRRAFVEWLQEHPVYAADLDEKASMPRAVYGEFLKDVIAQTVADAKRRGIQVELIAQEVTDLDVNDNGVFLHAGNAEFSADLVILATGRCPDVDVYELGGASRERYFPLHIPGTRLDTIPIDAEVHVLGTSLSAYDVVNQLFTASTTCRFVPDGPERLTYEANDNHRRVVLCSRGGRLKKIKSRHPYRIDPQFFSLQELQESGAHQVTLCSLFELMQKDATEHGVDIDWQALADPYAGCESPAEVNQRANEILARDIDAAASAADSTANFIVDYLDAVQFEMWDVFAAQLLSPEEESLFRWKYESPLLSFAAPCPSLTAQKILALLQAGALRIVQGVNAVTDDDESFRIDHRFGSERAAYLVNASGAVDRSVASERQPQLIRNLQRKGIVQAYRRLGKSGQGMDVDLQTFRSAGSDRVLVANMFLWGPGYYVSSAIMMATIVERLLAAAFERD